MYAFCCCCCCLALDIRASDGVWIGSLTGVFSPVDIDVFEGGLLWAAQLEGKIMRSDKFGEDEIKTIQTGLHMPRAVSVYHIYRYDISSEWKCLY